MPRTTAGVVKKVLKRDYDFINNPDLSHDIASAHSLVNQVKVMADSRGTPQLESDLTLMEAWLSAYFYALSDRPYDRDRTADSESYFSGKTAMGLDANLYGQGAKRLDYSGCLTEITSDTILLTAIWLGKPESEQLTHDQRN